MANNISLQGIRRWHICTGELAKDCTKSHRALIKLHIACKKLHIACTQFELRCEHMLPLVGGKEHSQVAYLLERLSSVILTISPNRFSFCQLLSITISSRVHVDQLNYRDGPSKGVSKSNNSLLDQTVTNSFTTLRSGGEVPQ